MKNLAGKLPLTIMLGLIALLGFGATHHAWAFAAGTAPTDSSSLLDLLKPVFDAFAGGHYAYAAAVGVIAGVSLLKRYAGSGKFGAFVHSDKGGALTALLLADAGAMASGLAAPGAHVTFALLKSAALVGVGAAGGFAILKNLFVDPILKKYVVPNAPAVSQPFLSFVISLFEHGDDGLKALASARAAGDTAVAAQPAQGVAAVTGKPADVP
jgi:hypothetical protein